MKNPTGTQSINHLPIRERVDFFRDLPHTAEAPEALPLVVVVFSLHLAWQPTSIHDGFVMPGQFSFHEFLLA
ncbi:hypothetical protein JQC72_00220 [Polycladomyces sp. WAk]|uniref:Uncharacterized protein n=1 Tax=Polycladomyces zharkentensis TaxID=2807616 RepID=A0ABS2WEF7_9BACL|nr:hypothetical protein [Polycladomyces sp. WAk]MBN2907945.1 hypothetical protein [Polycladomyces sp. WAk]